MTRFSTKLKITLIEQILIVILHILNNRIFTLCTMNIEKVEANKE